MDSYTDEPRSMTGPEHYKEAERFIRWSLRPGDQGDVLALAQVHATLALAAATALRRPTEGLPSRDFVGWHLAAGTKPEDGSS